MMSRHVGKLNKKGETITEMLVSVLIGALATAMLATTIAYSVKITKRVDATDTQLRQDITLAESQSGTPISGTIVIPDMKNGTNKGDVVVNVKFYGNERLMSFKAISFGSSSK